MKGFVFTSLSTLALHQQVLAAEPLFSLERTVDLSAQQSVSLFVDVPEKRYFRGTVSGSAAISSAYIYDSAGNQIKRLTQHQSIEQDIFWLAEKADRYRITINAASQPTQLTVQLQQMVLKKDQFVSPERDITSPTLKHLHQQLNTAEHDAILDQFWQTIAQQGTPLVEPINEQESLVTFLWRGNIGSVENVRLLGAPYEGHAHLTHINNSDVWFVSYSLPSATRLSYQLAVNVPQLEGDFWFEQRRAVLATIAADPLNQHPWQADTQTQVMSTFELDHAPDDQYTQIGSAPMGTVDNTQFYSDILKNQRKVSFYSPNSTYTVNQSAPLLITFDGDDYQTKIPTPIILDNLIAEGKIPPLYAVFINNPTPSLRAQELPPNPNFADFMVKELLPWARAQFEQPFAAQDVIVTGSSFGGLASMYLGFTHPDSFGNVLSQSGSFWWAEKDQPEEWLTQQITQSEAVHLNVYLNAGLFEISPEFANILHTNRRLFDVLKHKGYSVNYQEFASGHDYFSWRTTLASGLIALFNSGSFSTQKTQ